MRITRFCTYKTTYEYTEDFNSRDLDEVRRKVIEDLKYYPHNHVTEVPQVTFHAVELALIDIEQLWAEYPEWKQPITDDAEPTLGILLKWTIEDRICEWGGEPVGDDELLEDEVQIEWQNDDAGDGLGDDEE